MITAETIINIFDTLIEKRNLLDRKCTYTVSAYFTDTKHGIVYCGDAIIFYNCNDKYIIGITEDANEKRYIYISTNSLDSKIEISESIYHLIKLKFIEISKMLDQELENKVNNLIYNL
jgi:hypothetical protein